MSDPVEYGVPRIGRRMRGVQVATFGLTLEGEHGAVVAGAAAIAAMSSVK